MVEELTIAAKKSTHQQRTYHCCVFVHCTSRRHVLCPTGAEILLVSQPPIAKPETVAPHALTRLDRHLRFGSQPTPPLFDHRVTYMHAYNNVSRCVFRTSPRLRLFHLLEFFAPYPITTGARGSTSRYRASRMIRGHLLMPQCTSI